MRFCMPIAVAKFADAPGPLADWSLSSWTVAVDVGHLGAATQAISSQGPAQGCHVRRLDVHHYFLRTWPWSVLVVWNCVCGLGNAWCCRVTSRPVAAFQIHFWALPKNGDREDAFVPVEFSEDYQKSLIGHPENHVRDAARVVFAPC